MFSKPLFLKSLKKKERKERKKRKKKYTCCYYVQRLSVLHKFADWEKVGLDSEWFLCCYQISSSLNSSHRSKTWWVSAEYQLSLPLLKCLVIPWGSGLTLKRPWWNVFEQVTKSQPDAGALLCSWPWSLTCTVKGASNILFIIAEENSTMKYFVWLYIRKYFHCHTNSYYFHRLLALKPHWKLSLLLSLSLRCSFITSQCTCLALYIPHYSCAVRQHKLPYCIHGITLLPTLV